MHSHARFDHWPTVAYTKVAMTALRERFKDRGFKTQTPDANVVVGDRLAPARAESNMAPITSEEKKREDDCSP